MPDRVALLYVFAAGLALVAALGMAEKRLSARHSAGTKRLVVAGSIVVVVLEVVVLLLLAGTSDHFDPRCMQPQTQCP